MSLLLLIITMLIGGGFSPDLNEQRRKASAAAANVFSVNTSVPRTELNGQPFQVVGIRASNALISDAATDELVQNMDLFGTYRINTFSVFFQGSRYGNIKGFNQDASLNTVYAARMARIIQAANSRGMVVLVGVLYGGGSSAMWDNWGQNEANLAVANTVRWLRDNGFRNVFIDVNNEHMAPFNDGQLIAAGKAVDSSFVMGTSGRDTPQNADVSLHFGSTNIPGKPYIESEGTPDGYWGSYSRDDGNGNYRNVGIYTDSMKESWKQRTTGTLNSGKGYIGAATWLQSVPPLGPNHRPGGNGTSGDPGIRFWLEHVKQLVNPGGSTPPPGPATASLTLYDADTDLPISQHNPLRDGATINLAEARKLNIVYNAPAGVASVKFGLNGNSNFHVENSAPFSLAGDENWGTNFLAWTPRLGANTVTATPYPQTRARGTAGTPTTITFTVIDSPVVVPTATAAPTQTPSPQPTASPAPTATAQPTGLFVTSLAGDWGFNVQHPSGIKGNVSLTVHDASGRVVHRHHERSGPYCAYGNLPGRSCTVPKLARGTYRIEALVTANDGARLVLEHSVVVR